MNKYIKSLNFLKVISLLALLSITVACTTAGTVVKKEDVRKIRNGVTTEQQVRQLFGEPLSEVTQGNKRTLTYGSRKNDSLGSNAAGVVGMTVGSMVGGLGGLGALGGGFLGKNAVKERREATHLTVIINTQNNRVLSHTYTTSKSRSANMKVGT